MSRIRDRERRTVQNNNNLEEDRAWLARQSVGVLIESCDWRKFSCLYDRPWSRIQVRRWGVIFWGKQQQSQRCGLGGLHQSHSRKSRKGWVHKNRRGGGRGGSPFSSFFLLFFSFVVKHGEIWEGGQKIGLHHMHQWSLETIPECWLWLLKEQPTMSNRPMVFTARERGQRALQVLGL